MIPRLLSTLALAVPLLAGAAAPEPASRAATGTTTPETVEPVTTGPVPAAPVVTAPVATAPDVAAPAPAPAVRPPAPAPVPVPSGSATSSLLQTMFALVVVLVLLAGLAWALKRYGPKMGGGAAHLRIVGSLSLGGRERLLVVEVGEQWIVVGASPGRVNALATMPRQDPQNALPAGTDGATLAPHQAPASNFADWLKQTIDKRK